MMKSNMFSLDVWSTWRIKANLKPFPQSVCCYTVITLLCGRCDEMNRKLCVNKMKCLLFHCQEQKERTAFKCGRCDQEITSKKPFGWLRCFWKCGPVDANVFGFGWFEVNNYMNSNEHCSVDYPHYPHVFLSSFHGTWNEKATYLMGFVFAIGFMINFTCHKTWNSNAIW